MYVYIDIDDRYTHTYNKYVYIIDLFILSIDTYTVYICIHTYICKYVCNYVLDHRYWEVSRLRSTSWSKVCTPGAGPAREGGSV